MTHSEDTQLIRKGKSLSTLADDNVEKETSCVVKTKAILAKLVGYFAGIFSSLLMGVSAGCAQVLGGLVPDFELNLWRFAAQVVCSGPVLFLMGQSIRVTRKELPYMVLLCVAYNIFNWTYYGAAPLLPVGILGCLGPTILLVEASVVQAVLSRSCRIHVVVAIVMCLGGAVFLTQPDFLFGDASDDYTTHSVCIDDVYDVYDVTEVYTLVDANGFQYNVTNSTNVTSLRPPETDYVLGYIYMVIAPTAHVIVVFTIKLGLPDMAPLVIIFWVGLSGIALSVAGMFIFETVVLPRSAVCMTMLLGHSFTASFGYIFQTIAVLAISPVMYALVVTLQMVFMVVGQYTVLKDVNAGHGNVMEVLGAVAVLAGNVIGPFYRMYEEAMGTAPAEDPLHSKAAKTDSTQLGDSATPVEDNAGADDVVEQIQQ